MNIKCCKCNGTGIIKTIPIKCKSCNGNTSGCGKCKMGYLIDSSYIGINWKECESCYGTGKNISIKQYCRLINV